jgi:hypothetical protein
MGDDGGLNGILNEDRINLKTLWIFRRVSFNYIYCVLYPNEFVSPRT